MSRTGAARESIRPALASLSQAARQKGSSLLHVRDEAELHVLPYRLELLRLRLLRISCLGDVALPGALVLLFAFREQAGVLGVRLNVVPVGLLAAPEVPERDELRAEIL